MGNIGNLDETVSPKKLKEYSHTCGIYFDLNWTRHKPVGKKLLKKIPVSEANQLGKSLVLLLNYRMCTLKAHVFPFSLHL